MRVTIPAVAADGSFYPVEKMEAHRRGLLHLAISIFLFDGDRLLIQQRARSKYHCGGLWANTVCSHPHWGEAPADAADRRLREELGLETPLRAGRVVEYRAEVGGGLVEHERVHMFVGAAPAGRPDPDPDEVAATRWVAVEALRRELRDEPTRFAPWFRIYAAKWPEIALAGAEPA